METIIKVEGMTCGHCQKAVENALNDLKGVNQVNVFLDKGEVSIAYNENEVRIENLRNAIAEQGYDVK